MILKEPVAALLERRDHYLKAQSYYEGDVAERFASSRIARVFRNTGHTSLNFCRPVVHAVSNRLSIASIAPNKPSAKKVVNAVLDHNEFAIEEKEFYRRTCEFGDSYVIVWPDADGNWTLSSNSPLSMTLVYDVENPRLKLYAVKSWTIGNDTYMNIYTKESITKYRAQGSSLSEGLQWNVYDTVDNPFDEIPVFHFRTERPFGRPEHEAAYDSQDYINKLFTTNMYTIDYQGAPQRYALANAESGLDDYEDDDIQRENINGLKSGPGEMWYLNGVTQVGQFAPADPDVFWKPIESTLEVMASATETPLHYFRNNGAFISGEAWRTAEGVLASKIEARKASFASTWRYIFRFILKAEGFAGVDVEIKWMETDNLDTLDQWDVMLKKINSGLSYHQALRESGYDEETIERIFQERLAEKELIDGLYERNSSSGQLVRSEQTRVSTTDNETFETENN